MFHIEQSRKQDVYNKMIVYWLGTEKSPQYNIIEAHQLLSFDEAIRKKIVQKCLSIIPRAGNPHDDTMVRGTRLAVRLNAEKSSCKRFDTLKAGFFEIGENFFYNPDRNNMGCLSSGDQSDSEEIDAVFKEYIDDHDATTSRSDSFEADSSDDEEWVA